MSLKRSDKIIAVVGVIILILAAIGVIIYTQPEDDEPEKTTDLEKQTYMVSYKTVDGSPLSKNFQIKKPFLLSKGASAVDEATFIISQYNIKDVTFKIVYNDDVPRKGDTLEVTITAPDGNDYQCENIVGSSGEEGKLVTIKDVNQMITVPSIEAESEEDAQTELESYYKSNFMDHAFKINIQLTIAEKLGLLNQIQKLLERVKKDSVSIEMTYTYYQYTLETETEADGDNDDDDGDNNPSGYNGGLGSYFNSMTYGNRW